MALNWLDYIIIVSIALSVIVSFARGFIREALSLASWVAAFWVGISFSGYVAELLAPYIETEALRQGIAFFALFVIVLVLGVIISCLLARTVQKTGLGATDRMLGVVFGLGRGIVIVALLLLIASLSSLATASWWQNSVLIPRFEPLVTWLQTLLPDDLEFNRHEQNSHEDQPIIDESSLEAEQQ